MVYAFSNLTVADIVREKLSRARVFDHYEIDFYCLGDRSLSEACLDADVNPRQVCADLIAHDAVADYKDEAAWRTGSVHALTTHILDRHHTYLRTQLPHLHELFDRVVETCRGDCPELEKIQETFLALEKELNAHMTKEEHVLFPILERLEQAQAERQAQPPFPFGGVTGPIQAMAYEHMDAADLMCELRGLTGCYRPPENAYGAHRALLSGLDELETDLHVYIHKENNILFPQVSNIEAALSIRA